MHYITQSHPPSTAFPAILTWSHPRKSKANTAMVANIPPISAKVVCRVTLSPTCFMDATRPPTSEPIKVAPPDIPPKIHQCCVHTLSIKRLAWTYKLIMSVYSDSPVWARLLLSVQLT